MSALKEFVFQIGRYGPGLTTIVVEAHSLFEAERRAASQAARMGIAHPDLTFLSWEHVDEREPDEWTRRWEEHEAQMNPLGGDHIDD